MRVRKKPFVCCYRGSGIPAFMQEKSAYRWKEMPYGMTTIENISVGIPIENLAADPQGSFFQ
jgi:hypothetical protein